MSFTQPITNDHTEKSKFERLFDGYNRRPQSVEFSGYVDDKPPITKDQTNDQTKDQTKDQTNDQTEKSKFEQWLYDCGENPTWASFS